MNTLVVIVGPTGVGKTALSIELAQKLHCSIISADSRQIYREMRIGTATPSDAELQSVKHFFIGSRSIHESYSAGQYEADALSVISSEFSKNSKLILIGGSMMYVDAVCRGFDEIPTIDAAVREQVRRDYAEKGLEYLQDELQRLDPDHYETVDLQNHQRVMRAVEVCRQTGGHYSDLRKGAVAQRPFCIVKIGLDRPRAELYSLINTRVDQMIDEGLLDEARQLYPYRDLNSLNTVGYKELFDYFDGKYDLNEAVRLIKRDSRRYAKRQLTWFRADPEIRWFNADEIKADDILNLLDKIEIDENK